MGLYTRPNGYVTRNCHVEQENYILNNNNDMYDRSEYFDMHDNPNE